MDLPKKSIIAPVDLYCASSAVAPAPGDALDAPEEVVVDPLELDTVVFAPLTGATDPDDSATVESPPINPLALARMMLPPDPFSPFLVRCQRSQRAPSPPHAVGP